MINSPFNYNLHDNNNCNHSNHSNGMNTPTTVTTVTTSTTTNDGKPLGFLFILKYSLPKDFVYQVHFTNNYLGTTTPMNGDNKGERGSKHASQASGTFFFFFFFFFDY